MSRQSLPPRAQGAQRGDETRMALCAFDAHMMSLIPNWKPMNEKELREGMYASGATEETYEQYLECENRLMEQKIKRDGLLVVGVKPLPGDPSVYTVPIPDSPHVIRMWEGGMGFYGHFCLDFYDTERKTPVNLPAGFGLYGGAANMPPGLNYAPPPPPIHYLPKSVRAEIDAWARARPPPALGSWERNLGMTAIPEGEEKWSFPDGTCLILKRDGRPDFGFQVPTRQQPAFAQPQRGYRY